MSDNNDRHETKFTLTGPTKKTVAIMIPSAILAGVLIAVLFGFGGNTDNSIDPSQLPTPLPTATDTTTPAPKATIPVYQQEATTVEFQKENTAVVTRGETLILKPNSMKDLVGWEVTSDVERSIVYMPGYSSERLLFIPSVRFLEAGTITLTITNGTKTYKVTVESLPNDPETTPEDINALATRVVGQSEAQALAEIAQAGYTSRVVSRDGEDLAVTMDYSETRINLTIVNLMVTAATIG